MPPAEEDLLADRGVVSTAHWHRDLDGLPGGAFSGVQPDLSCSGGGKMEDPFPRSA